mgnify:CR=1 FL=1
MAYRFLLSILLIKLLAAYTVSYGGEFYMDGQNARNAAMGGYSVSFSDGSNPALLVHSSEPSVHFSHKNKFTGLANINSFSYLYWGENSPIYISLLSRRVNHIPDTRSAWMDDGDSTPEIGEINYFNIEEISQQEIGVKIASIRTYNQITLGINVKPFYTGLAEYNAWGLSGDIAAIYSPFNKYEFCLRIEDIINFKSWNTGTIETFRPLIMAGVRIQFLSLLFGVEAGSRLEQNSRLNYHAGVEFQQHENLFLRGGISGDSKFSVGIGLHLKMVGIDYAYVYPPKDYPFQASHIISTSFYLEKLNQIKGKITP